MKEKEKDNSIEIVVASNNRDLVLPFPVVKSKIVKTQEDQLELPMEFVKTEVTYPASKTINTEKNRIMPLSSVEYDEPEELSIITNIPL